MKSSLQREMLSGWKKKIHWNVVQMCWGWFKSDLMTGSSHSITRTMCAGWWAGGLTCYYLLLLPCHLLLSCLAPHQIVLYGPCSCSQYCQQVELSEDTDGTRSVLKTRIYNSSWSKSYQHHHNSILNFYFYFSQYFGGCDWCELEAL